MSSAGSTRNAKAVRSTAKKLMILGALLTLFSQILNSHLIYVFNLHYKIYQDFLLEEGVSEKYVVQVSESDVIILAYNLTLEIEGESRAGLKILFLGEGDRITKSIDLEVSKEIKNVTGNVTIDGYLKSVVLSIKEGEWRSIRGSIGLDYTRGQPELLLLSVASALTGIIGVIVLGYSLIIYVISKGETRSRKTAKEASPPE